MKSYIEPDQYNTYNVISLGAQFGLEAMRATGRTSKLVQKLQDGDVVVFDQTQMLTFFEMAVRRAGKHHVRFFPLIDRSYDLERLTSKIGETIMPRAGFANRVLYDHVWIENYYTKTLERAAADLELLGIRTQQRCDSYVRYEYVPFEHHKDEK